MHRPAPNRLDYGKVDLGITLRATRNQSGLTLAEVAERTGFTVSYLSDVERGRTLPSLDALLKLCDTFAIRVSTLLDEIYPFGTAPRPRRRPTPPTDGRRR